MGLFSTIGSFFGPVGTAVGALGDGLVGYADKKQQAKRSNKAEMNKYVRLREASERGGFHPLETLRAGGEVRHTVAPRLLSSLSATNSFDALEDEITGEGARQRRRAEVDDEIRERQLQILQKQTVDGLTNRPTVRTNRPPRVVGGPVTPLADFGIQPGASDYEYTAPMEPVDIDRNDPPGSVRQGQFMLPPGTIKTEPGEAPATSMFQPRVWPNGRTTYAPEDIDETVMHGVAFGAQLLDENFFNGETPTPADYEMIRQRLRERYPNASKEERERMFDQITKGK